MTIHRVRFRAAITFFFDVVVSFVPEPKSSDPHGTLETILYFPDMMNELGRCQGPGYWNGQVQGG